MLFHLLPVADPRPEETGGAAAATDTFTEDEGTSTYSAQYTLALETEILMKRTFTAPGTEYLLIMRAENMHNENDTALMTW